MKPSAPDINDAAREGVGLTDLMGAARAHGPVAIKAEAERAWLAEEALQLLDDLAAQFIDPTTDAQEAKIAVAALMDDDKLARLACGLQVHEHEIERRLMTMKVPHGCGGVITTLTRAMKAKLRAMEQDERETTTHRASRSTNLRRVLRELDLPEGVKLRAPAGWSVDVDGIEEVMVTKDEQVRVIPLTARPVVIIGRGLGEASTGEDGAMGRRDHYSVIAWRRAGSETWVRHVVRDDVLGSRNGLARLRRHGAPFHEANAAAAIRYLADFYEANAATIPTVTFCRRLGWQGGAFLLGERAITATTEGATSVALDMPDNMGVIAQAFHERGKWEGWLKVVRDHVLHRPKVLLAIYASAAAPLVRILNCEGFTVDWSADSSTGKSHTHKIGASVWGAPKEEGGLIFPWRNTPSWVGNALGFLFNLPLILDDTAKLEDTRHLTALLYDIAGGREKGRAMADGGVQEQSRWATLVLSNGEAPLTSFVTKTGAVARCISIKGAPFGEAAQGSEQQAQNARDAVEVKAELLKHYGHLGPRLIRWLVQNPERWPDIRTRYRELADVWRDAAGHYGKVAQRIAQHVAVLEVSAELLHTYIGLPVPSSVGADDRAVWDMLWESVRQGGHDSDRASNALADLWNWVIGNRAAFDPKAKKDEGRVGAWLRTSPREEVPPLSEMWREIGIQPQVVRKLLREWGYEPNNILQVWADREWAPRGDRRLGVARPFCGSRAHLLVLTRAAIEGVLDGGAPDEDEVGPEEIADDMPF